MKTLINFVFRFGETENLATVLWPMGNLPRVGEQIFGMGLPDWAFEGCHVVSVSYLTDDPAVEVWTEPNRNIELGEVEIEEACRLLELYGWKIQRDIETHYPEDDLSDEEASLSGFESPTNRIVPE